MSVIVNHLNLGKNYEAFFVCPEMYKEYFTAVAAVLEGEKAIKSRVFCYDSEKLSERVKRKLKKSKNVVFVLTEGVTERAATEKDNAFRKVYGYVWKNNPHSLSLMTANDVFVDYDIEYPEEMVSFKWLHRKRYDVHGSTAGQLADELFNELRIGFAQTEKRRLEKLAEKGQSEYLHIYEKDVRGMKGALLWLCISFVSSLLIMYTGLYEKSFAFLLILLAAIFAAVGVGYICYTLMASLCARYELFNVSVLFKEFKNRTARRVCAILGIGMWTGIFYLAYLFLDIADKRDANMNIALISVFVIIIALTIVGLVKASVLDSTAFTSAHYIELCERRPKTHITFIIVYAIVFAALFVGSLIILL